jgi:hypothetical protein
MEGHERRGHPKTWAKDGGQIYCLACRRERAAEASLEAAPEDTPAEARVKLRQAAVIGFEIDRDPDRTNGEIAKAARCSPLTVTKVRKALEANSN